MPPPDHPRHDRLPGVRRDIGEVAFGECFKGGDLGAKDGCDDAVVGCVGFFGLTDLPVVGDGRAVDGLGRTR